MRKRQTRFETMRRARLLRGLSQGQLAKRLGLRQPLLSDFERGVLIPNRETRARIARVLGQPEDSLFPVEER